MDDAGVDGDGQSVNGARARARHATRRAQLNKQAAWGETYVRYMSWCSIADQPADTVRLAAECQGGDCAQRLLDALCKNT